MFTIEDPHSRRPEVTDTHIDVLDVHLTEYITAYLNNGMCASPDGEVYGTENLPYLVMLMMNEPMEGTLSAGFIGYIIGKKLTVRDTRANVPRALMRAGLQILRKYEDTDTQIADFVAGLDEAVKAGDTSNKEIPDNVTPILH